MSVIQILSVSHSSSRHLITGHLAFATYLIGKFGKLCLKYSGDPKTGHLNTGAIQKLDVLAVRLSNGSISLA